MILLSLILITSFAGATAVELCVPDLLAHLPHRTNYPSTMPEWHMEDIGLPSSVRDVAPLQLEGPEHRGTWMAKHFGTRVGQATDHLNGDVVLETSLGSTLWNENELTQWRRLRPLTTNAGMAQREIARLVKEPGYCTPGLDPFLCESLRTSRSLHVEAVTQEQNLKRARTLAYQTHQKTFTPLLPWLNLRDGQINVALTDAQALAVLRIFARESLIAHLLYVDFQHRVHQGLRIPRHVRLELAKNPALVEVAPIFELRPPAINGEVTYVDTEPGRVTVLQGPLRMGNANGRLHITAQSAPNAWMVRYLAPGFENATRAERKAFQIAIEARLNSKARGFWRAARLKTTPAFHAEWLTDRSGWMEFRAPEPSLRDEVMFYFSLLNEMKG